MAVYCVAEDVFACIVVCLQPAVGPPWRCTQCPFVAATGPALKLHTTRVRADAHALHHGMR